MTANMIAAIVITVVAIVASALALRFLTSGVITKLKREVLRYIKVYNQYLNDPNETKTEEKKPENSKKDILPLEENLAIPFVPKSVSLQNADFFADYSKLRTNFSIKDEQLSEVLVSIQKNQSEEILSVASAESLEGLLSLYQKLDFETSYQISCLVPEKQLLLLEDICMKKEWEWVKKYLFDYPGEFLVTEFVSFLECKVREADRKIILYTRDEKELKGIKNMDVSQVKKDETLLEGFWVLVGNRMYDYGVRQSEIC